MAAKISLRSIGSAADLIAYLLEVAQSDTRAIARGHADASWHLLPSVWRHGKITKRLRAIRENESSWYLSLPHSKSAKDAARKYLGRRTEGDVARLRELVIQLRAEVCLVQKFCAECDRVALSVPGHTEAGSKISIDEHVLQFDAEAELPTPYVNVGAAFAFAQHYRIPTRLLDFSDDPLKAAYFAVPVEAAAKEFAVWLVREIGQESPGYFDNVQIIRVLRLQIPYLHAQDGLFVACNVSSNRYFLQNGSWPSIDKLLAGHSIEKVVCPTKIAKEVRKLLKRLGVSDTTMMPSYEIVSQHLRDSYIK